MGPSDDAPIELTDRFRPARSTHRLPERTSSRNRRASVRMAWTAASSEGFVKPTIRPVSPSSTNEATGAIPMTGLTAGGHRLGHDPREELGGARVHEDAGDAASSSPRTSSPTSPSSSTEPKLARCRA